MFLNTSGHITRWVNRIMTDALYIPERLAGRFVDLASYFRQKKVFTEIAVPQILGIINNGTDTIVSLKVHTGLYSPYAGTVSKLCSTGQCPCTSPLGLIGWSGRERRQWDFISGQNPDGLLQARVLVGLLLRVGDKGCTAMRGGLFD